jgi:hypothetical protein
LRLRYPIGFAGDRGLDREGHLLVAARGVQALVGGDEASAGLLERLPHFGGRTAVLAGEPVLPGDDDPGSLAAFAGVERFAEGTLAPRLRAGDSLLDQLGREGRPLFCAPAWMSRRCSSIEIVRSFSFTDAAPPELAEPLYEWFCAALRGLGVEVSAGRFGARMAVELVNDGPVTIVLE